MRIGIEEIGWSMLGFFIVMMGITLSVFIYLIIKGEPNGSLDFDDVDEHRYHYDDNKYGIDVEDVPTPNISIGLSDPTNPAFEEFLL